MKTDSIENLKDQVDRWSDQVDKIEAEIEKSGAEAKSRYKSMLIDLKKRRDQALNRAEALRRASGEAVSELKKEFTNAFHDLGDGMRAAKEAFSGVI